MHAQKHKKSALISDGVPFCKRTLKPKLTESVCGYSQVERKKKTMSTYNNYYEPWRRVRVGGLQLVQCCEMKKSNTMEIVMNVHMNDGNAAYRNYSSPQTEEKDKKHLLPQAKMRESVRMFCECFGVKMKWKAAGCKSFRKVRLSVRRVLAGTTLFLTSSM